MNTIKHKNYELLNLIGYGLAKFGAKFTKEFGFKAKTSFYEYIVSLKLADTTGTIKNRQDLFDPFFDNGRKGWWQKGEAYIHRKITIDSLFGDLNVQQYADIVRLYIQNSCGTVESIAQISPVMKSCFKQLQITGREAELYFIHNYNVIETFSGGLLDDARLFGDGYDFQIKVCKKYYLAEVKGIKDLSGSIRLTENEFIKANEYKKDYGLVVVSNLVDSPKMTAVFDPIKNLNLSKKVASQRQTTYHSDFIIW